MKKLYMLVIGLTLALMAAGSAASAQRRFGFDEEETIRRTLEFAPDNGAKILEVDNVNGQIHVTGYDGQNVEMVAHKTIIARTNSTLQIARDDVKLDITEKADTINIFVREPGHERSTLSSTHSNSGNRGYEVSFDFDIRVPRRAGVHLWNVNGGPIEVEDIAGDFYVNNINGRIEMQKISGSGWAHTINGPLRVTFDKNPTEDSHFGSLNGQIEVTFRPDLSADLRFKSFNGGVYTDFPVTTVPSNVDVSRTASGKFVYRNDFSQARVGQGGPTLEFDGFNGNIKIRQGK
jgi:DUF4097 and DUF4098 domain-containing protein YvlB